MGRGGNANAFRVKTRVKTTMREGVDQMFNIAVCTNILGCRPHPDLIRFCFHCTDNQFVIALEIDLIDWHHSMHIFTVNR